MAYIILVVLTLAIFGVVLKPVFEARRYQHGIESNSLNDLRARRAYLLEALRDVDLDYATGKVERSEYEETRRAYIRDAAIVLREIERHTGEINADIEQEIQQLRQMARQPMQETDRPNAQSQSEA